MAWSSLARSSAQSSTGMELDRAEAVAVSSRPVPLSAQVELTVEMGGGLHRTVAVAMGGGKADARSGSATLRGRDFIKSREGQPDPT